MSTIAPMIDQQAGPRLRAWLKAQDPPRAAEIARRAGVSRQFVSNVMAGRAKPTQAIVEACEELGLPVEVIFGPGMRQNGAP
jgi:transcriptional regulator with XRE-family HTH domain